MSKIAAILLIIGGAVHAIPPLYALLTQLTGGVPVIQIIAGVASILVAFPLLSADSKAAYGK
ncbi:MAG: hypothetical protein AB7P76_10645 [Candidatus Melainabacteria bacterium]